VIIYIRTTLYRKRPLHCTVWSCGRLVVFAFLSFTKVSLCFTILQGRTNNDSGGAYPGCIFSRSYDCHGEGLIIPPVKIIERGKIDEKAYSVILKNLRGSTMVRADNMLVYGSMKKIEQRIIGLLKEYGKET